MPFRSEPEPLSVGGPIDEDGVGEMSMGSRGGASVEPEDGRIGIDLCRLGLWGSGENGLRRASATDAIMADGYRGVVVLGCWAASPDGASGTSKQRAANCAV